MEKKSFVCIECPRGCLLTVEEGEGAPRVSGNFCPRGKAYAEAEVTCPRRVLTATVRGKTQRVPVKTRGEIRRDLLFSVMEKVHAVRVDGPLKIGDVVLADVDGEGTDLIAAANYDGE